MFNPKDYTYHNKIYIDNSEEFYSIFIEESLKIGFKMNTRAIEKTRKLPALATIRNNYGKLTDIYAECSLRSEEFAKLPIKKITHNRGLKNYYIAIEYIDKCLLMGVVKKRIS